jgi:uncharacterized integral membrane protein (TIGR00697 family)
VINQQKQQMTKQTKIFIILACIFVSNVILAEFIGVKIFSLESTFGFEARNWSFFGMPIQLHYTCGVIIWPVVFVMTDIINDYYGRNGVRMLTYIAVGITMYAFLVSNLAINVSPASWWIGSNQAMGVPDNNLAFKAVFGQGNNIIVGSLIAFVLSQFLDIFIFNKIKEKKGQGAIWIRATASTMVSQLLDSFVVIYVAFYFGQGWSNEQSFQVALNNYIYKGIIAILLIPVLHLIHKALENYFGQDLSNKMRQNALSKDSGFDFLA